MQWDISDQILILSVIPPVPLRLEYEEIGISRLRDHFSIYLLGWKVKVLSLVHRATLAVQDMLYDVLNFDGMEKAQSASGNFSAIRHIIKNTSGQEPLRKVMLQFFALDDNRLAQKYPAHVQIIMEGYPKFAVMSPKLTLRRAMKARRQQTLGSWKNAGWDDRKCSDFEHA